MMMNSKARNLEMSPSRAANSVFSVVKFDVGQIHGHSSCQTILGHVNPDFAVWLDEDGWAAHALHHLLSLWVTLLLMHFPQHLHLRSYLHPLGVCVWKPESLTRLYHCVGE